jgi:predicted GNAT family acetyltransferase
MPDMPTLERIDDPATFVRAAFPFLLEHEAEHSLMLGLAGRAVDAPDAYDEPAYEVVIRDEGGAVAAAALRTPPFNLIVSDTALPDAVDLLVEDAAARFGDLPGVLGPSAVAARFAEAWAARSGTSATLEFAQRAFRADRVSIPDDVAGSSREAGPADRALLIAWLEAFLAEALPTSAAVEDQAKEVARRERDPDAGFLLWEHEDSPVAMAGWGGRTPNGIRIGPVYTPPAHRRRGYASVLTAVLSERLLAGGRRSCFLFTDLANPTSNAIYQRIGYRPLGDVDRYRFDAAGA